MIKGNPLWKNVLDKFIKKANYWDTGRINKCSTVRRMLKITNKINCGGLLRQGTNFQCHNKFYNIRSRVLQHNPTMIRIRNIDWKIQTYNYILIMNGKVDSKH